MNPMRIALIATVFNEGEGIFRWAESLRQQTRKPDEFVIVDGGSTDGTPERLKKAFSHDDFPAPRIIVKKCNIAGGRNLAIQNTMAEIIAASDAGSFPAPDWLAEITGPLLENPGLDVTGGLNIAEVATPFQKFLAQLESREVTGVSNGEVHPSSRNTAFRRSAFEAVGGYPEWLTLAGEDALFTHELNRIGKKFLFNPKAIVRWSLRETAEAYYRLLYRNAYGAAEAQLYWPYFRQRIIISLCPPLLLLSQHRFKHLKFRYLRSFSSARGWLAGKISGHRPPDGWRQVGGILLSPEALKSYGQS
jgi:glycosyltransferase involved in cell wall biosynthesis